MSRCSAPRFLSSFLAMMSSYSSSDIYSGLISLQNWSLPYLVNNFPLMVQDDMSWRCSLNYLLTPWSRVLLEKLTGSATSQEIPRIFGTRRFLTVLRSAHHLSLSWANSIQSPQSPTTSWRSILILSSHLRLGLPNGLFHAWSYDRKKILNFFFGLTSHLADCFICHNQGTQDIYLNSLRNIVGIIWLVWF
jgi:hypothetical protein